MKTTLNHLPEKKQKELRLITDYIREVFDPKAAILYGSYARGDWVDIEREYQSDYDILIICGHKQKRNYTLRSKLEERVRMDDDIVTSVSFNYEQYSVVNNEIRKYNYLFIDIRREGILLYSKGEFKLEDVKDLEPKERYEKAVQDFEHWLDSSKEFGRTYRTTLKDLQNSKSKTIALNICAFLLHQSTEHLYVALLLVFTGYKPKTHHLDDLEKLVLPFQKKIHEAFPRKTEAEKHLYDLLRNAYVDARYDVNYRITKEELNSLFALVEKFRGLVNDLCDQKLKELKGLF